MEYSEQPALEGRGPSNFAPDPQHSSLPFFELMKYATKKCGMCKTFKKLTDHVRVVVVKNKYLVFLKVTGSQK